MSYARAVATNTGVQVLGRVGTTLSSLITVALLNSFLGASGWGQYVAATTLVGFIAVFADLGLNALYLRELSRYPDKSNETTATFYGLRVVSAVFFFALAPLIAFAVPVYRDMMAPIALFSLAQFFLVMNQMLVSVVQAQLKMGRAVLADFLGRITVLGGTFFAVGALSPDLRLGAAATALVIGNAVNFLLMLAFVWRIQKPVFRFLPKAWKPTLVAAIPVAGLSVLSLIHFKSDSLILTFLRTPEEVGIYGNAYKVVEILLVLPAMFVGSVFPAMSRAVVERSERLQGLVQKAFDLLIYAAIPLIAILGILAPQIIGVLTENNVAETGAVLRILSFAMIPWFLSSLTGHLLLASEKQAQLFKIQLYAVILNIALNIFAIRAYGVFGAAVTTLISEAVVFVSAFVLIRKELGMKFGLTYVRNVIVMTVAVAAVLVVFTEMVTPPEGRLMAAFYTLGVIFGAGGLYVLISYLTKLLPPALQEKIALKRGAHG